MHTLLSLLTGTNFSLNLTSERKFHHQFTLDSIPRQSLPTAIETARAAVETGTAETNRDKLITGLACLVAAVSGKLGVLYGNDPLALTPAQQVQGH